MNKVIDQSLDHIIRNDEATLFVEPYGNDGVWLSLQAQRDAGVNSVGTSMSIETARQLRDALSAVLAGVALPVFTVEALTAGKNHHYTIDVHAKDEDAAIDCVLQQSFDTFRVLTCGSTEVVL
jgi:hypothetical protein